MDDALVKNHLIKSQSSIHLRSLFKRVDSSKWLIARKSLAEMVNPALSRPQPGRVEPAYKYLVRGMCIFFRLQAKLILLSEFLSVSLKKVSFCLYTIIYRFLLYRHNCAAQKLLPFRILRADFFLNHHPLLIFFNPFLYIRRFPLHYFNLVIINCKRKRQLLLVYFPYPRNCLSNCLEMGFCAENSIWLKCVIHIN